MMEEELVKEFTRKVMQLAGLSESPTGYLMDDDTGNVIQFNGKQLKTFNKFDIIGYNEMMFVPLFNKTQMNCIFSYFLERIANDEGIYFPISYITHSNKPGQAVVKDEHNNKIVSRTYTNDSVKLLDLMYKISEFPIEEDLSRFDNLQKG